jgi:hypothetical protein
MHRLKSNRGSAMLTALLFGAGIAICLSSFLVLSLHTSKVANRSFYFNAAQDLADSGLEHALWSLNNADVYTYPANFTTGNFTARSGFTNEFQGEFPSTGTASTDYYQLSGGAKGKVKVYMNYDPAITPTVADPYPYAVVQATVTLGDGTTLSKTVKSYLQQRSFSLGGMIARNGISFNGNVEVDSWIGHDDDANTANDESYAAAIAASPTRRRAEARIASPFLIAIQNADVYGYAAIGTDTFTPAGLTVGATGRLRGTIPGAVGVDTTRLTFDFTASFPEVKGVPTSGTLLGALSTTRALGTATYIASSLTYSGSADTLTVGESGPVDAILVVSGDVTMSGTSQIKVYPGSKLKMYVGGNISITGNAGIQNGTDTTPNMPANFKLLGTRTDAQVVASSNTFSTWEIKGTSYLSAVIYGPNANIDVNGTGDTYGSVVGNTVDMVGSGNFHQDESLGNVRESGLWALAKWRELTTPAERAVYATQLDFGTP